MPRLLCEKNRAFTFVEPDMRNMMGGTHFMSPAALSLRRETLCIISLSVGVNMGDRRTEAMSLLREKKKRSNSKDPHLDTKFRNRETSRLEITRESWDQPRTTYVCVVTIHKLDMHQGLSELRGCVGEVGASLGPADVTFR